MANLVYVITGMLHLYKFTVCCRCQQVLFRQEVVEMYEAEGSAREVHNDSTGYV